MRIEPRAGIPFAYNDRNVSLISIKKRVTRIGNTYIYHRREHGESKYSVLNSAVGNSFERSRAIGYNAARSEVTDSWLTEGI